MKTKDIELQEKFVESLKNINEQAKEEFLLKGKLNEMFLFLMEDGKLEVISSNEICSAGKVMGEKVDRNKITYLIKDYIQQKPEIFAVVQVAESWYHDGTNPDICKKLTEGSISVQDLDDKKESVFVVGSTRSGYKCLYSTQILRYNNGSNDLLESVEEENVDGRFTSFWK